MRILNFFRSSKKSASIAKERLQIIVSHESADNKDFIRDLQQELLDVISKYIDIDREQIRVQLDQSGAHSVLELNVTLPEQTKPKKTLARKEREEALATE